MDQNITSKESVESLHSTTQSTVSLTPDTRDKDEPYDPFEHRNVEHPTSTVGAFLHLLKSSLGSGLLAMPAAFKNAGLIPGCVGTLLVAVIATHCVQILICDTLAPSHNFGEKAFCGMLLLPLILITQIRHLKFLVPFSVLANICLLFTFGITCYYCFGAIPASPDVELVGSVAKWPLFLSTAIFAMEGINVVLPVENEMARPQRFLGWGGVLTATMALVAALYGVVGVFGYLTYGTEVEGIITLNLPKDQDLAMTAKILVVVAVFFTYCLQMYAPMDILWTRLKYRVAERYHNPAQVALRTASVVFTVILAIAVPKLELLIALVGAIFFSTLGLLIPLVVQTVHRWDRGLGKCSYILWKNSAMLVFYVVVLLSGCYTAMSGIIAEFKS